MNRRSLPLVTLVAAVIVLGLTVLNRAQAPAGQASGGGVFSTVQAGSEVTVFLRGDASGVAFTERSADGFLIGRQGKVVSIDEKWIVIENKGTRSFLPLSAVGVIDVAGK